MKSHVWSVKSSLLSPIFHDVRKRYTICNPCRFTAAICQNVFLAYRMTHQFQGSFLVAAPSLREDAFARTVVFVIQHSDQGAFGVVLNRPADERLNQVWQKLTGTSFVGIDRFSMGGPMGGPVFALHQSEPLSEVAVAPNVFLSSETRLIKQLARQSRNPFRVFAGLSGWAVGQLEAEIQRGKWFPVRRESELIFGNTDRLWETSLRLFGKQAWCEMLHVSDLCGNPELN